MYIKCINHFAK